MTTDTLSEKVSRKRNKLVPFTLTTLLTKQAVRGSRKGGSFERRIAKDLSLWVSDGNNARIFWRTAGSGAMATRFQHLHGTTVPTQIGDITYIHQDGKPLMDLFVIECRHGKAKHVSLVSSLLFHTQLANKKDALSLWHETKEKALTVKKQPMVIIRQDSFPILVGVSSSFCHNVMDYAGQVPSKVLYFPGERSYWFTWDVFFEWFRPEYLPLLRDRVWQ